MTVAVLILAALTATWLTAGHVDRAAPVRAGLTGAALTGARVTAATARHRWQDRADARALRSAARRGRWAKSRRGRTALGIEGIARATGRGLAIVAPAVAAGIATTPGAYRAYRDDARERRTKPTTAAIDDQTRPGNPNQPPPTREAEEEGGGGGIPTRAGATPPPSPPTTSTDTEPKEPTVTPATEHETLAQLDQALSDMHNVAVEATLVAAQADEATYLADPMSVCGFNPGSAVLTALLAVNEASPKPFDADAWAVSIGAARRAIAQVMATADDLAAVGASGQVEQLTSAN